MNVKPYIVYFDLDTPFGSEILKFTENAPLTCCRDCDFFMREIGDWCTLHGFGERGNMEDGYCAWAERRIADEQEN